MAKLSAKTPKDPDAWGLAVADKEAVKEYLYTGHKDTIPVIGVIKLESTVAEGEEGEIPKPTGTYTIPRLEAITDRELKRVARAALEQQVVRRRGPAAGTLPYDERGLLDDAFGVIFTAEDARRERDEAEETINNLLGDTLTLRLHMVVVHKEDPHGLVDTGSASDIEAEHRRLHEEGPAEGMPPHDVGWRGWTRLDLETAEAVSDGEPEPEVQPGEPGWLADASGLMTGGPMGEAVSITVVEEADSDGDLNPDHEDVAVDYDADMGESVLAGEDEG